MFDNRILHFLLFSSCLTLRQLYAVAAVEERK